MALRARRPTSPLATTGLAMVLVALGAGCSTDVDGLGSDPGSVGDAGAAGDDASGHGGDDDDAGPVRSPDGGRHPDTGVAPAEAGPAPGDASSPLDAGPSTTCASTASIAALLMQHGSDDTASTLTPMGKRFEAAAQAGPLSASAAALLSSPSQNPDLAKATSATGLVWHPVKVTLYPSGKPSPEDISQHAIGDCDGDSALASMAYVNPELIPSLITDMHDSTYRVAMFDPRGKPVTVAVDSQVLVEAGSLTSLGQVSARDGTADWATILEKAVIKYDIAYGMVGVLDGIGSETLVPMFTGTGGSVAIAPGSLTPAELQQVVTVSLAAGKFVTGGFDQALPLGLDVTVTAHGYAVMVPTSPTVDLVDMRNPWGVNPWANTSASGYDTATDGLLRLPLATSPTDWPQIVDLRIIDPGPHCAGVSVPFVPQLQKADAPIHIREPHGAR